ncbi:MAG: hypothetical protein KIT72_16780 [Polyangiaceae bacterium]|nr:hypothetical protein [Polyangiaceae bacterium]MCW5792074.1 hypothetical protein [Polyangiaceae bacterium]
MGIDGMGGSGKPGGVLPPPSPSGAPGATGESFKLDAAEAPVAAPELSPALQQLQAGEINLDQYLDLQVDGAVAHLEGKLSVSELSVVRDTLREQLVSDPVLVELTTRATGISPTDS